MGVLDEEQDDIISRFERAFTNYTPMIWDEEPYMGMLNYMNEGKEYSLTVSHYAGLGFCIYFSIFDKAATQQKRIGAWISISNRNLINYFVDVYSDCLVSVGTFISPLETFAHIKKFVDNPEGFSDYIGKNKQFDKYEVVPVHPINGGGNLKGGLPADVAECYELKGKDLLVPVYNHFTPVDERNHKTVSLNHQL